MGQRSPRDDNAQEHCEYPFGPEEERLMHFAVEVAYKRPPIQIEVKNGGYHEDQAEPDMQTAPLILRQSNILQPVQCAMRPGGVTNNTMPVTDIARKDRAVATETNARQWNQRGDFAFDAGCFSCCRCDS